MSPSRRDLDYLPRVLSKLGFCSRRDAERLVAAGRVTVNGVVRREVLCEVHPTRDAIAVDGTAVAKAAAIHLKMNKPLGVVTTMKDPEGRPTVAGLIPEKWRGAMPVGRLDQDSTGLLLLTNDHSLGHRITGPDHHVAKRYEVELNGQPEDEDFAPIREGIELDGERERCRPAQVRILERRPRSTLVEVVLDEGKFRQIRRSMKALGLRVRALHRVKIGAIELGDLSPGAVVELTKAELASLTSPASGPPRE
jgi:23S rRNA pseudouridine2605 synthase